MSDYRDMTDAELAREARRLAARLTELRSVCEGRSIRFDMEYFDGEEWEMQEGNVTVGAGYIVTVRRVEVTEL